MRRVGAVAVLSALVAFGIVGTAYAVGAGTGYSDSYQTSTFCATLGCHPGTYESWTQSEHASPVTRAIDRGGNCRSCHVTNWDPADDDYSEPGAGCEACHGPGHTSASNDVNMRSSEICGQCHNRHAESTLVPGREYAVGYLPGMLLADFVNTPAPEGFPGVTPFATENFYTTYPSWHTYSHGGGGQQYQEWRQSRHAQAGIGCVSCHTVHETGVRAMDDPDVPGVRGHAMLKAAPFDLCAQCHSGSNLKVGSVPRDPQVAMLRGETGVGVAKVTHVHANYCMECHMVPTGYSHSGSPSEAGNHLWKVVMPGVAEELTTTISHDGHDEEVSMPASSCSGCHGTASDPLAARLQTVIDQRQGQIGADVAALEGRLAALAGAAQADAAAKKLYDEAKYNVDLVKADGSGGFHNYQYAAQLLFAANERLDDLSAAGPGGTGFTDLSPGDLYYDEVTFLATQGIVGGFADGTYKPYKAVARAQFAKMIVLTKGIHTPMVENIDDPSFSDVPFTGDYPYDYVEEAAAAGIVGGFADGTFKPYANITRVQIVRMIVRAGGSALATPPAGYAIPFTDVDEADRADVAKAYYNGIVGGTSASTFAPYDDANRGQVAKMLYRLYNLLD